MKVKVTGNNKLYCHIAYTNLGSSTKRLEKGQKIGFLSLADIVDDSPLSTLCIERLFSDPTSNVNTISNESNPKNDSIPSATNIPPTVPPKVDYSIPENRCNYIKILIKGKCEPGNKAEKLLNDLLKKYTSVVKCPKEKKNLEAVF